MKKILFVITLLLMGISNVNAEPCDAYDIKRLKEIANGVEITYELQESIEYDGDIIKDMYQINIYGLTDEIYLYDVDEKKYIDINSELSFKLRGCIKKFQVKSICSTVLRTISLELPVYNDYYNTWECEDERIKDSSVCKEWVTKAVTEKDLINAKKAQDAINEKNNANNKKVIMYVIILLSILFIGGIIFILFKRKREELN